MSASPLPPRHVVRPGDELLKLPPLDTPLTPAAELVRRQVAALDQALACASLVASSSATCGMVRKRSGRLRGRARSLDAAEWTVFATGHNVIHKYHEGVAAKGGRDHRLLLRDPSRSTN